MKDMITLAHGSGGKEMGELIDSFKIINRGSWKNYDDDSSTFDLGNGKSLVFTTDSFVVDPVFFPGGNIGDLAICGTINDLAVMGAKPIGISLAAVIEEGFYNVDLQKILKTINKISKDFDVPIVTGDTKVMQKGKIDKIIFNTSGIGIVTNEKLLTKKLNVGDKIIVSGGLGEHAVALLSKRFNYETSIITDSKPLLEEINAIHDNIKFARDITRGGLSAVLNEISKKQNIGILINDEMIPAKKEVINVTNMLGIDLFSLACEGRFVCIATEKNAQDVLKKLQSFNNMAEIIGEVIDDDKVIVQTILGKRILPEPRGRIVPRIC